MFAGSCWWVTGASSGIGEALAHGLAENGARLILSGRNRDALATLAERCGADQCLILPFEATDYAAIPGQVATALQWAGRINGLINNAGISQRSLAVETDFSVYDRIVAVDLLAPIALTQAVLPHMVAAGGGHMVAISSVAGIAGVPMRSAYCAAKHGLIGYADAVRAETAHLGMQVLVVAPGSVQTNVSRNAILADGSTRGVSDAAIEAGMPADVAAAAMIAAIADGTRELILAEGGEATVAAVRRSDPNKLFDMMAASMQSGYAEKMKADQGL
jgi:dehydrogenase/reductase SDR family member 7B